MSDDEENAERDLAQAGEIAGIGIDGGTAAAVTALAAANPPLAALVVMVGGLSKVALPPILRRFKRFLDGAADHWQSTAEEAAQRLEAASGSEGAEETCLESFRALSDAVDPEAARVLGALTASYLDAERGPDDAFRAFGRAIAEMTAGEFAALHRLMDEIAGALPELAEQHTALVAPKIWQLRLAFDDDRVVKQVGIEAVTPSRERKTVKPAGQHFTPAPELARVWTLLGRHGVALRLRHDGGEDLLEVAPDRVHWIREVLALPSK